MGISHSPLPTTPMCHETPSLWPQELCQWASAVWFHEALVFTVNRIAVRSLHRSPGQVGLVKQCRVVGTAFGGLDLNLDLATYQYATFSSYQASVSSCQNWDGDTYTFESMNLKLNRECKNTEYGAWDPVKAHSIRLLCQKQLFLKMVAVQKN